MTRRDFIAKTLAATTIFLAKPKLLAKTQNNTAKIFSNIIAKASKLGWQNMEMSDLMARTALEFLNVQYVGGTLDINPKQEITIVNLAALDCVTFFENSLCLARCIKKEHFRYADLIDEVTFTRYRGGEVGDYTSRLHYTSSWIIDNVKKNVIEDISESLAGESHNFELNYMSKHPKNYLALKKNPEFIKKIAEIENELSKQKFFIIKSENIEAISSKIQDGDIIAIATSQAGLDYAHTGIAFNKNLLHASSKAKKVIIDNSIAKFVKANKKFIGISVLRPKNAV